MYSKKKLNEKVHLLRDLERQASDIGVQIENLKYEIQSYMNEKAVSEIVGDDWRVTWNFYGSSRFDSRSFKESHPSLYEEFTVPYEARRFFLK